MDGRVRRLAFLAAAAALGSVGCKLFQREQDPMANAALPVAGQQTKGNWFNSTPKYGPQQEQIPMRMATKKGQAFKPETLNAVGEAELEAAFDDTRSGADRDQLIDVARQRYESTLKQDPKNRDALLGLGKLYTWAGDHGRAMQWYTEATRQHPKDRDIALAVVKCHIRFQDWESACKACEAAVAADPDNRHFTKTLGYCQARVNRWDDAFGTLMKIMSESEARTFLGQTLIALGRVPEGQQQLQTAVTADPNNENAKTVLAAMRDGTHPAIQQAGAETQPPR